MIPEEISSLWRSLTAGALDCILLVTSIGRYSAEEVKMVEFITQNLFEGKGLLQERILIVITRSESYLIDDKNEAKKWLEKESKNEVFRHYLNLVKNDTDRIIFVDNRNVEREPSRFDKVVLMQNNNKMAQKVLDPIHQLKGGPVSILSVVKKIMDEISALDQRIRNAKDDEERKNLGIAHLYYLKA